MKKLLGFAFLLAFWGFVPQIFGDYYLALLTKMLIFGIFAMSLDLIVGYARLPSLGHAAFFGVAAYTIAIFSTRVSPNFWLNFPLSIAIAGAVAAIFGLLVLRTQAGYFFMITLALAQVLWGLAITCRFITGGFDGIPSIPRPELGFIPLSMWEPANYFYFVSIIFAAAFVLMFIIVRSPFGHIILGIRECELRMRALGYNTFLHRYICFIISGLFAGLSGALEVYLTGFWRTLSVPILRDGTWYWEWHIYSL